MAYNYNTYYGSFIRNQYDYPTVDYTYNPDEANFGINYSGTVAAIWVGASPTQYAFCELNTDTSLRFSHSTGNLSNFTVESTKISLNSPLVDCQYEIRAPLGTFTSLSAPYKLFNIPHPLKKDKRLLHACLEGPEIAIYIRGKLNNENTIQLPDYWENLADPESICVTLTPIGEFQELFVKSIDFENKCITIDSNKTIQCHYMVTATRLDVKPLEIEING